MRLDKDGKGQPVELNLTREKATDTIIKNLVSAGILLRGEEQRYRKVLASYDNLTLIKVLLHSHELRDAGGEIISGKIL